MSERERLLEYMQAHPSWHYGLDLVRATGVSRGNIYVHLGTLEEQGQVEVKRVPSGFAHLGATERPMYRIARSGSVQFAEGMEPA